MPALSSIAMATAAAAALAGTGMAVSQAMEGPPSVPDMPDVPAAPTPATTPELEMPDPGDVRKKKQKQATILKGMSGGSGDTVLSDMKLGG